MKKVYLITAALVMTVGLGVAQGPNNNQKLISSPKLKTDKPNILVIWGDDIGW